MEYSLRPKITRFLLSRLDVDADFTSFHFDVNVDKKWVYISEKTPMEYIRKLLPDFDLVINGAPFSSVA
jgi:hypothetical protein